MPNSAQMLGTLRAQKAAPQIDVVIMDVSVSKAGDRREAVRQDRREASRRTSPISIPTARIADVGGVAVTFDNLVLLYNKDTVKDGADSPGTRCADKQVCGQGRDPAACPIFRALSLDRSSSTRWRGGTDYLKKRRQGHQAARRDSRPTSRPGIRSRTSITPIINGQAAIGIGWNARAQVYADTSGGKLGAVLPQEGSVFQINTINS